MTAPQAAPRLRPRCAATLAGRPLPERPWVMRNWLPRRCVTLLTGDGGTGKSLLALQIMVAAAAGTNIFGLEIEPSNVFGLFCEDDPDEMHLRLDAINRGEGIEFQDLAGLHYDCRAGRENVLFSASQNQPGKPTPLWTEVRESARDLDARIVVIDTAADTFGGNENFRSDVRGYIQQLNRLALDIDGAVILTAHPSVAGLANGSGVSGSTAWRNSVRSHLYLRRPDSDGPRDPDLRILSRKKSNYARVDDDLRLRWQTGRFVVEGGGGGGVVERIAAQAAFLDCLAAMATQGRFVSPRATAPNFAPRVFSQMPQAAGRSAQELRGAMDGLFNSNRIKVAGVRDAARRSREAIVAVGSELDHG